MVTFFILYLNNFTNTYENFFILAVFIEFDGT